jgi:hypothetical protein
VGNPTDCRRRYPVFGRGTESLSVTDRVSVRLQPDADISGGWKYHFAATHFSFLGERITCV